MFPLFETIKVKDGRFHNLGFHNDRINRARKVLFNRFDDLDLSDFLYLPKSLGKGIHKCKVIYTTDIESVKFEPYVKREIRSLKMIHLWDFDYSHKYVARDGLNDLFNRRGACDDVLIIKNGLVTDTSYANIIFFDGKNWVTPNTPLLPGTKQRKLLMEKKILAATIPVEKIRHFQYAKVVNAMLDIDDTNPISMDRIFF